MKKIPFTLMLFVFLTLVLSPLGVAKASGDAKLEATYSAYIDDLISKCEKRADMGKSRLSNIQREAALSCFKANFFKTYRQELIGEMMAENIGQKPHKIHYYLNARFFKMFRAAIEAVPHMRQQMAAL